MGVQHIDCALQGGSIVVMLLLAPFLEAALQDVVQVALRPARESEPESRG